MAGFAAVLAHQGGWDEALMVALPIGLFVALLRVATARADRQQRADEVGSSAAGDRSGPRRER